MFWGEDKVRRRMSWRELNDEVSRPAAGPSAPRETAQPGDRVAAYMPNMPETIVAMLAATSLGGVFTSCSPDFGIQGVLDRFGQIEPHFLISVDGYHYGGKTHGILPKLREIVSKLPTAPSIASSSPTPSPDPDLSGVRGATLLDAFIGQAEPEDIRFAQLPFDHPLAILFVRHDRRPEMHRAPNRRRAAGASQGARAARRHEARRPCVLLHHAWLDDVGTGWFRRSAAAQH